MNDYLEFEIRNTKDPAQPYYWRVRSKKNSKTLAHSENLTSKQACRDAIDLVKKHAATATVFDMTGAKPVVVS